MRFPRSASLILPGLALAAVFASDEKRVSARVGVYGPRGESRYAKPTFVWEIWPDDPKNKVIGVDLRIDGSVVPAAYDTDAKAVRYTPKTPLAAGKHKVACTVRVDPGVSFDQSWETTISDNAYAELPPPNAQQAEALVVANGLRAALGLPPMVSDARLNMAALLHSRYLSTNNVLGHVEAKGTPGFLGVSSADRLAAFGWVGGSWEDVSFGEEPVDRALRGLFDAPYHRIPFLQPGRVEFGAGLDGQQTTLEFGTTKEEATVISPADGQEEVPCRWRNYEQPNPLRRFAPDIRETGYPIVFARFDMYRSRWRRVSATLNGPDGEPVVCWLCNPSNDDALTNAAILIPQRPLRPRSVYRFSFEARDERTAIYRSQGSFRTGA